MSIIELTKKLTTVTSKLSFTQLFILGVTSIALLLRFNHLETQSMWEDEITRVLNATYYARDYFDVIRLASTQSQPPLSYWITRFVYQALQVSGLAWTNFWARFSSATFSLIAVPVFFVLARNWLGMHIALPSTVLFAFSHISIRYAREVGPISLWLLLTIVESFLFLRSTQTHRYLDWFLTLLAMVLSVYTHTFAFFVISVQVLVLSIILIKRHFLPADRINYYEFRDLLLGITSLALSTIIFLPLLQGIFHGGARFMHGLRMSGFDFVFLIINDFLPYSQANAFGTSIIISIVLLGCTAAIKKELFKGALLFCSVVFIPLLEYIIFVNFGLEYFRARYVISALPFTILAFVLGIWFVIDFVFTRFLEYASKTRLSKWILSAAVFALLIFNLPSSKNVYASYKQDWRGLSHYLKSILGPTDIILFEPEYYSQYYNYYSPTDFDTRDRYDPLIERTQIDNLYWVTSQNIPVGFTETPYGTLVISKKFTGGLTLWKLKVNKNLNHVPLLNENLRLFANGKPGSDVPVGWSEDSNGILSIQSDLEKASDRALIFRFGDRDMVSSFHSASVPVTPGRLVQLSADFEVEKVGKYGVVLSLKIKDDHGGSLVRFEADAVRSAAGWIKVNAGGIIPEHGHAAEVVVTAYAPFKGIGTISMRNIKLYGDWKGSISFYPLTQVSMPELDASADKDWWIMPENEFVTITGKTKLNDEASFLKAATKRAETDYLIRSPQLRLIESHGSWYVFGATVYTEKLSGPSGMEIAVGWVDENGKVFMWSESTRLVGTNNWQQLQVSGKVPQAAKAVILIPLRIFDSGGAGEIVKIRNVHFLIEGKVELEAPN